MGSNATIQVCVECHGEKKDLTTVVCRSDKDTQTHAETHRNMFLAS